MFFALASLGLPGMGNFVGEFLVLLGVYRAYLVGLAAVIGYRGAGGRYDLLPCGFVQKGVSRVERARLEASRTFNARELTSDGRGHRILKLLWLGLHPEPFLRTPRQALISLTGLDTISARLQVASDVEAHDDRRGSPFPFLPLILIGVGINCYVMLSIAILS